MNVHSQSVGESVDRREAVLAASLRLFSERGFHGTAVPTIAAEAKVATGTIYRYFRSKEELVNVLYRDCKGALMRGLLDGFPFHVPLREQARTLWHRLAGFAYAQPLAFDFLELHYHQSYLDAESQRLEQASLDRLFAFFQTDEAQRVIKPLPPAALLAMAWGMFAGLVKAERLGHVAWSDELVARTEACCWDALSLPEASARAAHPQDATGVPDPRS